MTAVAKVEEDDALVPEPIESQHVLVLGEERFECADKLPVRTLVRYADGGLEQIHHILVKLVHPDDTERMWDAFEDMPDDDSAMAAINELIATYSGDSDRPTGPSSRSSRGRARTGRK